MAPAGKAGGKDGDFKRFYLFFFLAHPCYSLYFGVIESTGPCPHYSLQVELRRRVVNHSLSHALTQVFFVERLLSHPTQRLTMAASAALKVVFFALMNIFSVVLIVSVSVTVAVGCLVSACAWRTALCECLSVRVLY